MDLKYDIDLDIATGDSRTCRTWTNRKWKWSEFVERCSKSKATSETMDEYHHKMTADQRGCVKDVGGFVGANLRGGIRKAGHAIVRSMATLDIDNGTPDVWERFITRFSCAGLLYSTHSYTPQQPRFRLVIPFKRPVSPSHEYTDESEYELVTAIIAHKMGKELFDKCSFEAERLLYWPSHPRDLDPVFEYRDAPALDVDELLKEPLPEDETVEDKPVEDARRDYIGRKAAKKAEDPLTKGGLIGAFCRAYSIEEAIDTFLQEYYVRVEKKGYHGENPRYTNIGSETTGGLICYDGKFAYSHHDHDPAGGRLCNAFDLCRIRLFGDKDTGKNQDDFTKLPSYKLMEDLAGKDEKVKELIRKERQEIAREDFGKISEPLERTPQDGISPTAWKKELKRNDKTGDCLKTPFNLRLIVLNDEQFKKVKYNLFFQCNEITSSDCEFKGTNSPWQVDDCSLGLMADYIFINYGINLSIKEVMERVLTPSARMRGFNPVKDYIMQQKWDGKPRVDTLLIDYLGAEDTPLNRMIMRKWMAGAVGRAIDYDRTTDSGIKMDYCIVLYGPQGCGKSTFIETLAVKWRGAISLTSSPKEQSEIIHRSWIVELPELKGLKSSETDAVKDLLSRREDIYRPAYGRTVVKQPRRCVFIGSTNNRYFLKDTTGERRFWVTEIQGKGKVADWVERLREETPQIWAEALEIYQSGERLMLSDEMEAEMAERAKGFSDIEGDSMKDAIAEWLDVRLPDDWDYLQPKEKAAFYNDTNNWQRGTVLRTRVAIYELKQYSRISGIGLCSSNRIGAILKALGWEKRRIRTSVGGGTGVRRGGTEHASIQTRYYIRPQSEGVTYNEDDDL